MKPAGKPIILWLVSLALFSGTGIVALTAPEELRGTFGLTLRLLLGYCSIIVVGQVLAAMKAIRNRPQTMPEGRKPTAAFTP